MLEVTDCTLLLSPETGATRRPLSILVSVRNQSNQFFTRCRLTIRLRTPRGFSAGELVLDGGAITPGEQVLAFESSIPNQPIGQVECELAYMVGRWVTTVRGIAPHQSAPAPAAAAPQAAAPEPPPPEDIPLEDVTMLPPVEGAEPYLGPDMDAMTPDDLEAALGPDMGREGEETGPDPEDPWSMLAAGEKDAAEALFRAQRLDSGGRERVRAMLKSDDPDEITLGIQIGRWGRWAAPMVMRALLGHEAPQVREAALTSLGMSAGPSLLSAVEPMVRDEVPEVRAAAELAVKRMRGLAPRGGG